LKNTFKKAAVSFDGNLLEDLSLVVSWVPNTSQLFFPEKFPNTRFLLGYQFVTLPPEFFDDHRIKNRQYKYNPEKVLVAMGGADENNLTQKVVDVLIKSNIDLQVTIVVGGGYEFSEELEKVLRISGLNFCLKNNITNMLEEYLKCDVAIGAGGLTASELVASRTPSLLIAAYEHQIERCMFFQSKGWVRYLGFRNINIDEIKNNILKSPSAVSYNPFRSKEIFIEICSFYN
jgi:spore coat polysaccharide biosynthesis predicted glycosyltransferase SpsG